MTQEEITNRLLSGNKNRYIEVLEDMCETLEDTIWVLKTSEQYNDNEIHQALENVRGYCRSIADDNRATGTIMKQLGI